MYTQHDACGNTILARGCIVATALQHPKVSYMFINLWAIMAQFMVIANW